MFTIGNLDLDISVLQSWRGLRPGMPRKEVVAVLQSSGLADADDPAEAEWISVPEWGMKLHCGQERGETLRQIDLDADGIHWEGKPLMKQPLHVALEVLGDAASQAGWRPENAALTVLDDLAPIASGEYHEEHLLDRGTLWLPRLGMGLVMCHGYVQELVWREQADIPQQTVSPVTQLQLEISRRPDLENHLRYWRPDRRMSQAQMILTGAFLISLLGIAVFAGQLQQRWSTAPVTVGVLVEIRPDTGIASRPYIVEFADDAGVRHTAALEAGDFFIAPTEPGEPVQLRYLPTTPIQAKGPAHIRDSAFSTCFPWAIGATAIYGALFCLIARRPRFVL